MSGKTVSQLDDDGYFVCAVLADASPLEPGVYLLPRGAVDRAPPAVVEPGKRYRVWGAGWRGEALPVVQEDLPPVPTAEQVRRGQVVARLVAIDGESVRPAREIALAVAAGEPAPAFAVSKLTALESEAAALRVELAALVL